MTARRLPGEGSISQESDGSWKWRLTHGTKPDGKPRVYVRRAQTLPALQAKIDKVKAELKAGVKTPAAGKLTVADWLREWIDEIRVIGAAPRTLEGYRTDARCYILPVIGHLRLGKLDTRDVNRVYTAMVQKGLAPSTVHHCHRTLHAALETAVEHKLLGYNPADAAEQPEPGEYEISPLTRDESLLVLKAAAERRNGARWRVALSLGLRTGEALALQVNDIDFAARRLHVRRQVQRLKWRHGCPDETTCTHEVRAKGGGKKTVKRRGCDCPQRQGPGGLVVRATKGNGPGQSRSPTRWPSSLPRRSRRWKRGPALLAGKPVQAEGGCFPPPPAASLILARTTTSGWACWTLPGSGGSADTMAATPPRRCC